MGRKEREFGNKQAAMLDDVTANLLDIDSKGRAVQVAIRDGDLATALIETGDVRRLATDSRLKIGLARQGIYEDRP